MKKTRDGLFGNFIPLRRAVEAIAARVKIPDDQIESRRGLNRQGGDDFKATMARGVIRKNLGEARAASILFRHLNQPPASCPTWLDSLVGGLLILDERVRREGLEILALWASIESTFMLHARYSGRQAGQTASPLNLGHMSPVSRLMQIGFDVDELIHFLDARGVAHTLGEALNPPVLAAQATALTSAVGAVTDLPFVAGASTNGEVEPAEADPVQSVGIHALIASGPRAEGSFGTALAATPATPPKGRFNDFSRSGRRCPIEREILEAKAECSEPVRSREVMARLLDKALAGHAVLKIKDDRLHYVGDDGGLLRYTPQALRLFIDPNKAAKREAAKEQRRAADAAKAQAHGVEAMPSAE